MTAEEQRIYLIRTLQEDMPEYKDIPVPQGEKEQKELIRALMNVRPPLPAGEGFLKVQDAYLTAESDMRGVIDAEKLPAVRSNPRIALWRGDITRLKADGIVNAANSALLGCFQPLHSCVDNIIHSASGVQLRIACNKIMQEQGRPEATGTAKITAAYNLPCSYVLHTVGPIISGPVRKEDCELLAACYRSCLMLAAEHGLASLAFCCISTGVFHFPQRKAAEIAVETVSRFLEHNPSIRKVIFDVYTEEDYEIYRELLEAETKR
ncbi:protein-ADP-ribose hydrolase [Anaerolentibacter hominis]|uniref:protein-ADP-ribose hydrolase n=1 Tax=Anaerolentibacter hominis TaxID=3079009 RepID=UPI0031B89FE6